MGGGAGALGLTLPNPDPEACRRQDHRQLVHDWLNADPGARLVTTTKDLMGLDLGKASKLMGIFAGDHLPYAAVKPEHVPSLANMTLQAVKMLRKNKNGFLLMVSVARDFQAPSFECVCRVVERFAESALENPRPAPITAYFRKQLFLAPRSCWTQ
jgi:hypothetical protein